MKRIHIFRPGRHRSRQGETIEFTEAQLRASAAAYDPAKHEAPIVVGHPSTDAPAYGWVRSLEYGTDGLSAVPDQVDTDFAEMVQAGRFKKVSASFYPPGHRSHPIQEGPGADAYYVRHVGFLGAHPPAVKGLKAAEFAADEEGVLEVEFGEDEPGLLSLLTTALRRLVRAPEFADPDYAGPHKSFPIKGPADVKDAWDLAGHAEDPEAVRRRILDIARRHGWTGALPQSARDWAKAHSISFSEESTTVQTEEQIKAREAEIAAREKAVAEKEAEFSERDEAITAREREAQKKAAEARKRDAVEFVEGLAKAGKVLPREQAPLTELLASFGEDAQVEFAEGDGTVKKPSAEILRDLLSSLPSRVDFGERAGAEGDGHATRAAASFTHEPGLQVDPERAALHRKAKAYASKHECSFAEAVAALETEE